MGCGCKKKKPNVVLKPKAGSNNIKVDTTKKKSK